MEREALTWMARALAPFAVRLEQFSAVWNGIEQLSPGLNCSKPSSAVAAGRAHRLALTSEGQPYTVRPEAHRRPYLSP